MKSFSILQKIVKGQVANSCDNFRLSAFWTDCIILHCNSTYTIVTVCVLVLTDHPRNFSDQIELFLANYTFEKQIILAILVMKVFFYKLQLFFIVHPHKFRHKIFDLFFFLGRGVNF